MSIKELQRYTRVAKYARYNADAQRRETWPEQVGRVIGMHRDYFSKRMGDSFNLISDELEFVEAKMLKKEILGSQRALQFGGVAIIDKNARMYNCSFSYVDRVDFFKECMYLCLCGVGVGFSVQTHHVNALPDITTRDKGIIRYTIPDSIEGWSDAIAMLVESYFVGYENTGHKIEFDYSEIRPAGALIKSSGSKAPGPDGLRRSMNEMEKLFDRCISYDQTKLRAIDAYDIVMHAADAVVSGGIRRAATLCLFSHDDELMMKAKTGTWSITDPQRARSNNSALLVRNNTTKDEFRKIFESVKEFGEPGFIFSDSTEAGYNPCVEIGMYAKHEVTGESGWSFCNLCEMNMKKVKTEEDFLDTCRAGAILGTLQAAYDTFPYLGEVTEYIVRREALLGVSMTGMMDTPEIAFDANLQRRGATLIKQVNKELALKLGINPAARSTCVKPAGSTSCILGSSSGIHPHHARRYFRRVQANKLENPLQFFQLWNPKAVETSVWDSNGKTDVITFLCEVPDGAKTKNQVNAIQLLEHVKLTQQNWVATGTDKSLCVKPYLHHNVSNTINVKPDEWDDVCDYIYKHRSSYAGISLLPISGDKDYPQAPFTTVYTPQEMVKQYGDATVFASGVIVRALRAFNGNLWDACASVLSCFGDINRDAYTTEDKYNESLVLKQVEYNGLPELQKEWVRKANKFAGNYFDGDVRKMTYLLKDVHNWKQWCDLKREYLEVPWEELHEADDNTKLSETVACAGGHCESRDI